MVYELALYFRPHLTGKQARPYGWERNGYCVYDFIVVVKDINPKQNQKILLSPNVGACPARPQRVCEDNCIFAKEPI